MRWGLSAHPWGGTEQESRCPVSRQLAGTERVGAHHGGLQACGGKLGKRPGQGAVVRGSVVEREIPDPPRFGLVLQRRGRLAEEAA